MERWKVVSEFSPSLQIFEFAQLHVCGYPGHGMSEQESWNQKLTHKYLASERFFKGSFWIPVKQCVNVYSGDRRWIMSREILPCKCLAEEICCVIGIMRADSQTCILWSFHFNVYSRSYTPEALTMLKYPWIEGDNHPMTCSHPVESYLDLCLTMSFVLLSVFCLWGVPHLSGQAGKRSVVVLDSGKPHPLLLLQSAITNCHGFSS